MSKSAVDHMDVRWRVKGTQAWSTPRAYKPSAEVAVDGLERDKQYEFQARNVSACGAMSVWVSNDYAVPPAPVGTLTLIGLQQSIQDAGSSAAAANAELAAIASDDVLSPAEKPNVMRDYSVITTEQAGIDAQAVQYGITTQKSDYDTAISTLTAYLNALNTPVPWNNKSGNTDITGSTFRGYFNAVYTTRQVLLNAIYAAAKGLADDARSAAGGAQDTANDAKNTANTALQNADGNASLINPQFNNGGPNGSINGWTVDGGTWVHQSGTNGPLSGTSSYAYRPGAAAKPNDAVRNTANFPVYAGAMVKASCLIRGTGSPNGSAQVRVSWRNASLGEISVTHGSPVTGNTTATSTVYAPAPAGAVIARIEADATGHTTGAYAVDNFTASATVDSLDNVPDGATRFGAISNAATQAQQAAQIAGSYMPGQNLLPNPRFALGTIGYQLAAYWSLARNVEAPVEIAYQFQTTLRTDTCVSGMVPFPPNTDAALAMDAICNSVNGGRVAADVEWFDASKTSLGFSARAFNVTDAGWNRYGAGVGKSPPNCLYARMRLFSESAYVTAIEAQFRATNLKLEIGTTPTAMNDAATQFGNLLTAPGSGQTVGDQRNITPITWAGVRSVLSTSPISFSISGTTVNFSVAAVTFNGGGFSVSYAASSGSVSQASGTTVGYYLYYRDPTSAGGSKSLYITSSPQALAAYADIVMLGSCNVTTNAGGGGTGGSGGGGGGFCVADDQFIGAGRRAGDAEIGDPFDCLDLPTAAGKHVRALRGLTRGVEECVRMITADGCALVCSVSTPFDLPDGRNATALYMLGEQVITDLGTTTVISLALVGPRPVTRAHLGGVSYAAGSDPHRRIYSHNAGVGGVLKP